MKIIVADHEIDIPDQEMVDFPSLGGHEGFQKVSASDLYLFAHSGKIYTAHKGEILCREGEAAEQLFFLLSGNVSLSKDDKLVTYLDGLDGHFGWYLNAESYFSTAAVESDAAILFKIHKDVLTAIFADRKSLGEQLYIYCLPYGAYLFVRSFNLQNFVVGQEEFLTSFKFQFYSPGETIIRKGDRAERFFMIASGNAKIITNDPDEPEKIVNFLHGGDYFGEIALLEDQKRVASVVAEGQIALFTLSRDAFNFLLSGKRGEFVKKYLRENIKKYTVKIDDITIGSDPSCDIHINSEKVAPFNAGLTKKTSSDGKKEYIVKPLDLSSAQYTVYVNRQEIIGETVVTEKDDLYISNFKIVINRNEDTVRVLEIDFYSLLTEDLLYQVEGYTAIDHVSFSAESHELVCIMGPSGCGKTTLLEMISGAKKQTAGNILYNQDPLYANLKFYQDSFGYVSQGDILFSELTVFENLYFSALLRDPFINKQRLDEKISEVLRRLKLLDKKHHRVGSIEKKGLSGGERKRVNIARELVFGPHVLFVDEPTSGLSSKDSEEIITLLREIGDAGKLVFVVLHQPSSKIFKLFDRIVLLDHGGKLVYAGSVIDCVDYMKEVVGDKTPAECPQCSSCRPEQIFEVLEERDEMGDRKFSPEFWQNRFQERFGKRPVQSDMADDLRHTVSRTKKNTLGEDARQIWLLLRRTFLVKVKDGHNVFVSLGAPIAIALLVGYILGYSPEKGAYAFYQNKLVLTYLFIGVIFSIFVGLTNSVRDIVSEQALFFIESKVRLRVRWYVLSKFLVLSFIAAVQVGVFLLICNFMLGIQEMFVTFFIFLYLGAMFGVSLGLFLSSFARTSDSVVNWIPLVLIPQIILGGALIEFEDINRSKYIFGDAQIPVFCQLVPSRWVHEAVVVAQATLNLRDLAIRKSNDETKELKRQLRELKESESPDEGALAVLRQKKKELLKDKAAIDEDFPIKIFHNELIEEALMDANGKYSGFIDGMVDNESVKEWTCLTTYKLTEQGLNLAKGTWFAAPFYAEEKGLFSEDHYYQIKTIYFNSMVMLFATFLDIGLCMIILREKRHKLLYV